MKAIELYKGDLWNNYLDVYHLLKNKLPYEVKLWILSAGYGLVPESASLTPYDITFQQAQGDIPSIFAKVSSCGETPRTLLRKWWALLSHNSGFNPPSLEQLVRGAGGSETFFLISGKDYIDAVYEDLTSALKLLKEENRFFIISNSENEGLLKKLQPFWLYADKRFVNLPKTNSTTLNAMIARQLLWTALESKDDSSLTTSNLNAILMTMAKGLKPVVTHNRTKLTDDEIREYIVTELSRGPVSSTRLHRIYRDQGSACEYKRFQKLFKEVQEEKNKEVVPWLSPISYTPRDAQIKFFLPDWDDRVDPKYDFVNDLSDNALQPYKRDSYHYELYGSLNCDGVLVSKSVLEASKVKKELAGSMGIHKYLRLPRNVPVFGDCGAFSYILDEVPPYQTDEILDYYDKMDFDYGVSIDHLVIPSVLSTTLYYRLADDWTLISEEEYNEMKSQPGVQVVEGRKKQRNLFEAGVVLCHETGTDLKKMEARYELTLKNGIEFFNSWKKKQYQFTPIGAVQGWDPDTYALMAKEYEAAGYDYIALGGLVKSGTDEIVRILEAVRSRVSKRVKIHVFGVARPDAIPRFMAIGVASVDSASSLRQAWLSSTDNYYTPGFRNYTAIRVPDTQSAKNQKTIEKNGFDVHEIAILEKNVLTLLRAYDTGKVSIELVMEALTEFGKPYGLPKGLLERYRDTLADKPWKRCECRICKNVGIEVVIFRGNNRNRRRGFHNTWVYYQWLKKM